jgi:hypothetical protein
MEIVMGAFSVVGIICSAVGMLIFVVCALFILNP